MSKYIERITKENKTLYKTNEELKQENSRLAEKVNTLLLEIQKLKERNITLERSKCRNNQMCKSFELSMGQIISTFGLTQNK